MSTPRSLSVTEPSALHLLHTGPFRLVLQPPLPGPEAMALDEALLETVGSGASGPVLRFYGFAPPTLSVGRFQRATGELRWEALAEERISVVRRPTGGHAVFHDRELTYAVVLGHTHLEPFTKRNVYRFVARLLLAGLARLGLAASMTETRIGDLHNPDCFGTAGEFEILSPSGSKLIGSAQMVTRTACLQQGSIPLDGSHRRIRGYLTEAVSNALGGVSSSSVGEELDREVSFEEVRAAFVTAAAEILSLQPGAPTEEEQRRADDLARTKYGEDRWTRML